MRVPAKKMTRSDAGLFLWASHNATRVRDDAARAKRALIRWLAAGQARRAQ
ncbi:hypothetical protein BPS26883_04008 [Burkholderia pseudomultivorans]|uniref:Uncharacterized protein n=1 Tax=Burkholderia pseudomultivorans TaxID=1207504 RepID=A0A6P2MUS3_9BURK|nr:hypothetical protein BPS26883_04008 [Burkholderia pseudomultivorans]